MGHRESMVAASTRRSFSPLLYEAHFYKRTSSLFASAKPSTADRVNHWDTARFTTLPNLDPVDCGSIEIHRRATRRAQR
ncbi:MAG: hypothetical protein AAGA56_25305 [Myxococcota bacterium]